MSRWILSRLQGTAAPIPASARVGDPLTDDDLHLALFLCYELHYDDLDGADASLEWDPSILAFRGLLEDLFERALRAAAVGPLPPSGSIASHLAALVRDDAGPSLSSHLRQEGRAEHYREFLIHRSAYQLREGDAHSWAIPRLKGPAKVALVEIQRDEYGGGDPRWTHSRLFAEAMRALGLAAERNAYLDRQPGSTLAWANLVSMFGLHRRLRGALVGHLAVFEMTSCIPNRRYADGLRRLGYGEQATRYFDEHVEADAVHEQIAAHDLAGGLAASEPHLEPDVLFGARALLLAEAAFARPLLEAWAAGRSSLLPDPVLSAV